MNGRHGRWAWLVGGATALLLAGSASASAAPIAISVSADPVEDLAFQVTLAGSGATNGEAFAKLKPAGGRPCGATYSADDGESFAYADSASATFTLPYNRTVGDPGDYLVCAWLQESSSSAAALAAASATVTVRQPRSSGSFAVPARVRPGATFKVAMTVQTEVSRLVFAKANAPGVPCGANYRADSGIDYVFYDVENQGGPSTYSANVTAPNRSGVYALCGYVQEGSEDAAAEAAFSAPFTVARPASAACRAARRRVSRYAAAVRRHASAAQRLSTRARRAHGRARRTLRHRAAVQRRVARRFAHRRAAARRQAARRCPR